MTSPESLKALVKAQLVALGEDPQREGLLKTPQRVARCLEFLTSGYRANLQEVLNDAIFEEPEANEMVVVRDIEVYSLCEHHLLPFLGKAHVAYLPRGKVVGLSKIPRILEVYARRLQVQERLTIQVAKALQGVLEPEGVGVIIEARHLCMMMRGVQKQASLATTSCMLGRFQSDAKTRAEFLELSGRRPIAW